MSWTWDEALGQPKDRVRLLIGDTEDPTTTGRQVLVHDETIEYFLELGESEPQVAVRVLLDLSAKYAHQANVTMGDTSVSLSDKADAARRAAQSIADQFGISVSGSTAGVYAGGISVTEKISDAQDTDLVQPGVRMGMHDNGGENSSSEPWLSPRVISP